LRYLNSLLRKSKIGCTLLDKIVGLKEEKNQFSADVLKEGSNSITEIFFKGTYCRRNQEKMEEDGEAEHIMPRGNDLHGSSAFRR
jgi:hypothetical protein